MCKRQFNALCRAVANSSQGITFAGFSNTSLNPFVSVGGHLSLSAGRHEHFCSESARGQIKDSVSGVSYHAGLEANPVQTGIHTFANQISAARTPHGSAMRGLSL